MPADIDVLVAGSSPINFSSNYLSERQPDYDEPRDLVTTAQSKPLDFPTALSSSPKTTGHHYLGRSPPSILGSSPPTHFTFHGRCSSPTLRSVPPPTVRNQLRLSSSNNSADMPVAVPRRPCLVVRCDVLDLPSPNKHKKRVVFADDRGFPLALVRTITEPSNMPPKWSFEFLSHVTNGGSCDVTAEPWELMFAQPASDYLNFRRRLDERNVSLENVIVKESDQSVVGTVKVRNLEFHKDIFIRMTADNWETYEDAFCSYVPNSPPAHGVTVLYDTFSFRLTLPPRSKKLQFCVCFRCSGSEYWDNNFGKNYTIIKREVQLKTQPQQQQQQVDSSGRKIPSESSCNKKINLSRRFSDDVVPNATLESWTEFASWNHLTNTTPYW